MTEGASSLLNPAFGAIKGRALPEGGFALFEGRGLDPAATAWATLALQGIPEHEDLCARARGSLVKLQESDGRVPVSHQHLDAIWPTSLFIMALYGTPALAAERQRAIDFLLGATGLHWPKGTDTTYGHDTSIPGWPWILGTHSWVAPTALAILALKGSGQARHERVAQAVRLLMDRQLKEGGWNYGNTTVFGTWLRPLPESTGHALAALAGSVPKTDVAKSIAYLKDEVAQIRTPLTLSWGILGLAVWRELSPDAGAWLEESLGLQARYGAYDTTLLAQLIVAWTVWAGRPTPLAGNAEP